MVADSNAPPEPATTMFEEASRRFLAFRQGCRSKFTLLEISGSCGDFGTLFPLLVALARERQIHLAATLFWTGWVHVITGIYWNLPMPLQPMHMISAQAISHALENPVQVAIAGMGMGISFFLLQLGKTDDSTAIQWLHRIIPTGVIGGLQLGVGWKLAVKGIQMVQPLPWWGNMDCIFMAILASVLVLYGLRREDSHSSRSSLPHDREQNGLREEDGEDNGDDGDIEPTIEPQHDFGDTLWLRSRCRSPCSKEPPVGLYLCSVGLILAGIQLIRQNSSDRVPPQPEPLIVFDALKAINGWEDWSTGLLSGTLPQLPLTTLNSCLSVCLLAHTLFPDLGGDDGLRHPITHKSLCLSIGCMNALLCPLGMMPHCHGAGGLAGQHRLGATSGVSMVLLGIFKLALSLVASQGSLLVLLDALPVSILGVLLALSGHELAITGIKAILKKNREQRSLHHSNAMADATLNQSSIADRSEINPERFSEDEASLNQEIAIALVTAVVIVATGKTHIGALCGWLAYIVHGTGCQDLFGMRDTMQLHIQEENLGNYIRIETNVNSEQVG